MNRIERAVDAITEDRRAAYLFDTKKAARAVGCVPNKFSDWWIRTQDKLIRLYQAQPGEFAAELAVLIALAEARRQRPPSCNCVPPTAPPPAP
ncbi:MAG TPA: hypothetical protein VLH09_10340 [Bryobacteraceae bacterium]|nr:hypothetical protein [Bryobacteraceae bacterium]